MATVVDSNYAIRTHSVLSTENNPFSPILVERSTMPKSSIEDPIYSVSVKNDPMNPGFIEDESDEDFFVNSNISSSGSMAIEHSLRNETTNPISVKVIGPLEEPKYRWPFTNTEISLGEEKITMNAGGHEILKRKNESISHPATPNPSPKTPKALCLRDYLMALSIFLITFITYGNTSSYSVLTVEWLKAFPQSKSLVLFVPNLTFALMSAVGVIDGFLINRYGLFRIIIFGCLLQTICIFSSSFSTNALTLVIILGFFVGIACCFCYLNCFILMGIHFGDAGKSFIAFLSLAGPICGVSFPNLLPIFIEMYTWRGAMIMLAAINIQMIPLALFLFLSQQKKKNVKQKNEVVEEDNLVLPAQKPFDVSLLKDPLFIAYLCTMTIGGAAGNTLYGLLPSFLNKKGLNLKQTAALYSIYCGLVAVPRVFTGLLQRWLNIRFLYIFIAFVSLFSVMCILTPRTESLLAVTVSCIFISLSKGTPIGLYTIGTLECVGPEKYSNASTLAETLLGIINAAFGYVGGVLVERNDSYEETFDLFGGTMLAANIYLFVTVIILKWKTKKVFSKF